MPLGRFLNFWNRQNRRSGVSMSYANRNYRYGSGFQRAVAAGGAAITLARAAWRGVRKLKGLVNSEMYKHDVAVSGQSIDNVGFVTHLTGIAQGDGDSQRTGNSVYVRSVNGKFVLSRTTSGDAAQQIRLSLIMDTQQAGDTTPTVTDIYESATPYSHLNSNSVGRYKVLWSRVYSMDTAKALSFNVFLNKAMRHHVRYNGTASTDIQKGGLYLVGTSTQATANFPSLNGEVRVSYHDN